MIEFLRNLTEGMMAMDSFLYRVGVLKLEELKVPTGVGYLIHWTGMNEMFSPVLAQRIRDNLESALAMEGWSSQSINRVLNKLSVAVMPNGIMVTVPDKIFAVYERGRRGYKMRPRQKPVPIRLSTGEIIFRKVTPQSIAKGRWYVPPQPGKFILRQILEEVREEVEIELMERSQRLMQRLSELVAEQFASTPNPFARGD